MPKAAKKNHSRISNSVSLGKGLILLLGIISFAVNCGAAFAQSDATYTGKILDLSLSEAVQQLNAVNLGPPSEAGAQMSLQVTANDGSYIVSYTAMSGLEPSENVVGGVMTNTYSWVWRGLDPSNVTLVYQPGSAPGEPAGAAPYAITANEKSDSKTTVSVTFSAYTYVDGTYTPAETQQENNIFIQTGSDQATAEHITDLVATIIKLTEGGHYTAKRALSRPTLLSGGTVMAIVEPSSIADGMDDVDVINNSSKEIRISIGTENCTNTLFCGEQFNELLGSKVTQPFSVKRADDTQSWSYSVYCVVNGVRNSGCSVGGGGGPEPAGNATNSDDDDTSPENTPTQNTGGSPSSQ